MTTGQLEPVLNIVRDVLGEDIVGAYLYGSAVLGGLRPRSDLDVMVIALRPTTEAEKRRLVARLLEVSGKPRPLELTIVVEEEIRPWTYPPRRDFQYGDWWREEFERGEIEPWGSPTDSDLASLIRMVLLADTPLLGPPPGEVFEGIPRHDYVASLTEGVEGLLDEVDPDTTNVLLTLARIWSSLVTDEIRSKDAAADWVLARIPAQHRAALAEARAIYVGDREQESDGLRTLARACAGYMATQIGQVSENREWSS